jgi:hypothetical protein
MPGMIRLSKNCRHGCEFDAASPPVSMSEGSNDCDRFHVRPTPASLVHMKMKTSGVETPPCTVICVAEEYIVDAETLLLELPN